MDRNFRAIVIVILGIQCTLGLPHGKRVICSFDYYYIYENIYKIDDIVPALDKCTHLSMYIATIDEKSLKVKADNPEQDVDMGLYNKTVALKKVFPYLAIMIVIKASGAIFTRISSAERNRQMFAETTVQFLIEHGFDGAEISWTDPGILGSGALLEDKANYVLLCKKLREEFDKNFLVYTLILPQTKRGIDAGIDGKELSKYAHSMVVDAFGYHNHQQGVVNVASPLYSLENNDEHTIDFTIQYYLKMGVDPRRLTLSLSNFFATFILRTEQHNTGDFIVGLPSKRVIEPFRSSYSYSELCKEFDSNANWTFRIDSKTKTPFAIESNRVFSIENAETYAEKIKYALDLNLGGISYKGLGSDDVRGTCKSSHHTKFPLLTSINEALNKYSKLPLEEIANCSKIYNSLFFWNGLKQ